MCKPNFTSLVHFLLILSLNAIFLLTAAACCYFCTHIHIAVSIYLSGFIYRVISETLIHDLIESVLKNLRWLLIVQRIELRVSLLTCTAMQTGAKQG